MDLGSSYFKNYETKKIGEGNLPSHFVLDKFEQKKNRLSVLELGIGKSPLFKNFLSKHDITAFDINDDAIDYINKHFPLLRVKKQDIRNSWEEKFDLIVDAHTMHLLLDAEEISKVFSHLKKSLKPQGEIYLEMAGVPDHFHYQHFLINQAGQIFGKESDLSLSGGFFVGNNYYLPFRRYFNAELEEVIKGLGFHILKLKYVNRSFHYQIEGESLSLPVVEIVLSC